METIDEVLEHFGIRGMKWGVRRDRGSDGTVGDAHPSSSHDAALAKDLSKRAKEHGTHTLSNQELQHLTKRLNLEQQYSNLTTSPKGHEVVSKGAKVAQEILLNVGKQHATTILSKQVAKSLPAFLK